PTVWSGPGIIVNLVRIPETSKITRGTLEKWFDDVYVPDLVATGVVTSAWRFKAANPDDAKQSMAIYKVLDLAPVQTGKLQTVKKTSETFPTDSHVDEFVESDSRMFSLVQLFQRERQPEDSATTIIMAAMEPAAGGEADLNAWYREEHNQQMSEQPGWKRTTRFKLLFQHKTDGKPNDAPSMFAIHEFGDGHKIGKDVVPLKPMTEWTKKCISEAKAIDVDCSANG
ncbi:hypothetical protein K469DRAFT_580245, partial [Zopfia rhizophila CBS 207.26]